MSEPRLTPEERAKCEACWTWFSNPSQGKHIQTTNGGLFLCQLCLDDVNRKSPLLADRDRQLVELRAVVPSLPPWIDSYPDSIDIARCNYDCGVTIGALKAALLPDQNPAKEG